MIIASFNLSTERDFMRVIRALAQEAKDRGLTTPDGVVEDCAKWEIIDETEVA